MADKTLSVPTIKVNNDVIAIVPNTFTFSAGDGEVNVRAASTGGGNATSVHSENAETMIGKAKFSMYPTVDNIAKIRNWKAAVAENTLEALQAGSAGGKDFSLAYKGMSVTNEPDFNAGADTVIEIEMAGDRIAQ